MVNGIGCIKRNLRARSKFDSVEKMKIRDRVSWMDAPFTALTNIELGSNHLILKQP